MSSYITFLITFAQLSDFGNSLLEVAFKAHKDHFPDDVWKYPREYEAKILELMPAHSKSGPVVDIRTIFDSIVNEADPKHQE